MQFTKQNEKIFVTCSNDVHSNGQFSGL